MRQLRPGTNFYGFFMNMKTFRLNCTSIHAFITNAQDNTPVTDTQLSEFIKILSKEHTKISASQIETLRRVVNRKLNFDDLKLSGTAKTELYKIYAYEMYNCGSITYGGNWMPIEKGQLAEASAVSLLSELDGIRYTKNEKLYKNRFFKGKPDIIVRNDDKTVKNIIEIKIPTSLADFVRMVEEGIDSEDEWQMRGYLDIMKCPQGEVVYCMVNMPEVIYNSEKQRILDICAKVDAPQKEIDRRLDILHSKMHYDHIPAHQRVLRFPVTNDESYIKNAQKRVKIARVWLQKLDELFKKPLNLVENIEQLPESID